jgi:hypothetical protein
MTKQSNVRRDYGGGLVALTISAEGGPSARSPDSRDERAGAEQGREKLSRKVAEKSGPSSSLV